MVVSEDRLEPPSLRRAVYDGTDTYVVQDDFTQSSFFHDLDSLKTKYVLAKAGEPIE